MNNNVFCLLVSLIIISACTSVPKVSITPEPEVILERIENGEYKPVCPTILSDDFASFFSPGWDFKGIYDIYSDGRLGKENQIFESVGGVYYSPFSVQSNSSIKVYSTLCCEPFAESYSFGKYSYDEDNNHLLLELNDFECLKYAYLLSLSDSEMKLVTPLYDLHDDKAVMTLFVFRKMTSEEIETLDERSISAE